MHGQNCRREKNIVRSIVIISFCSIILLSCAGRRAVLEEEKPLVSDKAEFLRSLRARNRELDNVIGRASVDIRTEVQRVYVTADYFFSSPDSFRANIRGILGSTPGALVSIGDSVSAYFPSRETLFIAVADSAPNPMLGLSIGFREMMLALIGRIDLDGVSDENIIFNTRSNSYELIVKRKNDFFRYEILADFSIVSEQIFSEDGANTIDFAFSDFKRTGEFNRHRKVTITNPMRGETIIIEIEKENIGVKIPAGIFELKVPEKVSIWRLL